MKKDAEHTLEFLLNFDGRRHWYEGGYWLKFEIKRVETSQGRPHGLGYSFTLHAPDGTRLVGFDNAHRAQPKGSRLKKRGRLMDHWHRTESDPGRPYAFKDAEKAD
ncbi:MAG: toxin-antitoxin system TumE family protein [Sulfuricaulis sp.]